MVIVVAVNLVGKDAYLAIMYGFVAFVFLRIIVNSYVKRKDVKAFNSLLNILFEQRNPKFFLQEIKEKINPNYLDKKQITTIQINKAIALCYGGDIAGAINLLSYVEERTEDENALLKIAFYHIMFKIIDETSDGVYEEILALKKLLKSKSTQRLLKSNLKSDRIQIKYLKSFENKILECELLLKIVNSEKLSFDDNELFKVLIEEKDSKLKYEMLYYFAAINMLSEGDRSGAIDFLSKIETTTICNTIIQRRSLKLKNEIMS
jgi:hypothetical protein